jgi:hypothetical protein
MAFQTNAKRASRTQTPDNQGNTTRETRTDRRDRTPGKKGLFDDNPLDRNGNGFITADDFLIGLRECFQWVFSWRGAMLVSGAFTIFAAVINITSWASAAGSLTAGFLCWGFLETLELMPVFDTFNLRSNIAALVRLQRKPVEVPTANETLNPGYKKRLRTYRNREKRQDQLFEAVRYICYGYEFAVLVGGGVLSPTGISWSAVILATVGIVGVELGLRLTNICGEKLLSADEREYMKSIEASIRRTSVTVSD